MIQKLVEYLIKQMVENKEAVTVSLNDHSDKTVINITVGEQDRGKVIGKEGRNIKALRSLITVVTSQEKRINIDIA